MNSNQENHINNHHDYNSIRSDDLIGGNYQKWKNYIENIKHQIKRIYPKISGKDMVKLSYELAKYKELAIPSTLNPKTATFSDIADYMRFELRYSESTIKLTINYLKKMELNQQVPIDLRNPNLEEIRLHFKYREIIEKTTPNTLINNLKAIKRYLKIVGINPDDIRYKPPILPEKSDKQVPKPETVHKLLTFKYSKDHYENSLIQYLLTHNFIIGWRVPSEPTIMKVSDIDFDNGSIVITEPKKHKRKRIIIPEEDILTSRRYKSFKNWVDYWRPKVENQYSKEYLYLQSNGKPFTDCCLRMRLSRKVKPVWSNYYPYVSRHWCAVARLLDWDLKVIRVRDFLGHVKIQTTMDYLKTANMYYDKKERNWIKRALRTHK